MPAPLQFTLDDDAGLTITRHFAAPPELVFRAHTDCALIRKWMTGPPDWTMPLCEIDPRPGGAYRHDFAGPNGEAFSIVGEILEIEPNRRIRHVEHMLMPDRTPDNNLETLFEPAGDGTKLTLHMRLPSAEVREATLASGMTDGMEMSYQALDGLISAGGI